MASNFEFRKQLRQEAVELGYAPDQIRAYIQEELARIEAAEERKAIREAEERREIRQAEAEKEREIREAEKERERLGRKEDK